MGTARGVYLLVENLMPFSLYTMIAGTITNIGLNYLLIPHYSGFGAILATQVSFFVTTFLIDFFYHKTKNNVKIQVTSILTCYKITLKMS